uniref:Uncharacterized protein n=1 Tax=Tanacetum cinerariifolium TaxID=118510 RepID=A0A699GNA0_TANCI|nr:hypothetical protein [Tanacetum cinerariifolium]
MTYDKVRPIFEREYMKVQTLFKPDKDVQEPKIKRVADETLLQESFKKLKASEVSGFESTQESHLMNLKEMTKEDVHNMLEIVPVSEFKVEALQVKYPIIDWEIHTEGSRTYWKIIRVGGITEAYQVFKDMLKGFNREDLVALWNLVKEKFNLAAKKDYPLSNDVMIMMLSGKLQVKDGQRSSYEDLHGGQQTKEQKFGYILQVIKMLELKKLDVKIMFFKDLRKMHKGITVVGSRLVLLDKVDAAAKVLKNLL